jgi:hypothetical protein
VARIDPTETRLPNRGRPRILRSRSGAAYVLAITTLIVGVILALAMLRSANAGFLSENSRRKKQAAYDLAEAGVDYAFWQIHYNGAYPPYSATVSLTTGSFQVTAVDDGNRDRSTLLITSTGTAGRDTYTIRRVTLGLLPYHYARCENSNISDADTVTSTGSGRGLRANGSIWLGSLFNNVTTGAWATSTISAWGTVTPTYPNSPPIRFPDIDYSYYLSIATYFVSGDKSYTSLNYPGQNVVIVVSHDAYVSGTYSGVVTIVAGHDATVSGNLVAANNSSYLALMAFHQVTIDSSATNVEGVFYSRTSSSSGLVNVKGYTTITGSACADSIVTDRNTAFNPSSRLNLAAMKQLRLPGLL